MFSGAEDGGVRAFHGFDGDAGGFGDNDGLADIEAGEVLRDGAAVGDVGLLLVGGRAAGEHAGRAQQRFEERGGVEEGDALVGEDLGHSADAASRYCA